MTLSFDGIDHIHLYVSDRTAAENWYRQHLGMKPVEALRDWATASGPLTIADADHKVHLALFERPESRASSSLAIGVNGPSFVAWHAHLRNTGLPVRVADHGRAWSMYFSDPDDNQLEITSYDPEYIASAGTTPTDGD